jgi:phage shock protein PspC (stress-responsive transcriptional regulator)
MEDEQDTEDFYKSEVEFSVLSSVVMGIAVGLGVALLLVEVVAVNTFVVVLGVVVALEMVTTVIVEKVKDPSHRNSVGKGRFPLLSKH